MNIEKILKETIIPDIDINITPPSDSIKFRHYEILSSINPKAEIEAIDLYISSDTL